MFTYSSNECGAGKTRAIINYLNKNPSTKGILVQNTMALMTQSSQSLTNYKVINTNTSTTVYEDIIEYIDSPTNQVLVISDKMFWKVGESIKAGMYEVFVDDSTSHIEHTSITEDNTRAKGIVQYDILSNVQQIPNTCFSTASIKDSKDHGDLMKDLTKKFDIIRNNDACIFNTSWLVEEETTKMAITAYKNLTKYSHLDIHFCANNFEQTLIYLANKHFFVKKDLDGIMTRTVPVQQRLKVFYFSDSDLSKSWKDKSQDELAKIYRYLNKVLPPNSFYWTKNNADSYKVDGVERFELAGHFISCDTRGINSMKGFDTCVWLACLRPSSTEIKQYEHLFGISGDELLRAREQETLWQFVMRGCIREFDSDKVQTVYVFSKEQAMSISTNIEKIELDITEKRKNGRPVGSTNAHILPDALNTRLKRFLATNPALAEFITWRNEKCKGISIADSKVMMTRFEKRQKKGGAK
ncbi:hypothetical protein ACRZOU_004428 [Aeromonas salmonicida]